MEQVSQQSAEQASAPLRPSQGSSMSQKVNQSVHDKPWMTIAAIGIFHLGVGFFFGHRYRAKT